MPLKNFIFMISAPRSGSTWLGNIFNSHPDIIYRHEPLARLSPLISKQTLHALKSNFHLSPAEHEELVELLVKLYPEACRPPFFQKSYLKLHPQFQYVAWLLASKWQTFKKAYVNHMLIPRAENLTLLIKETGWSSHLDSIITGLAPDHIIWLIRHPCAVISSLLEGMKQGNDYPTTSKKTKWFNIHQNNKYVVSKGIKLEDFLQYDPLVYWAIRIRVLYDIFIDLQNRNASNSYFINYEKFQKDPIRETKQIFQQVGLSYNQKVSRFLLESTNSNFKSFSIIRDAKNEYYSIKRNRQFDPHKWQNKLTNEQIESIKKIIGKSIWNQFWPNTY